MAILSEKTWERHANPWSGWSRVAIMPVLAAGLYSHNLWVLGVVILWAIINPLVFSKPKRVDNWMSKGVLGEQLYFQDGKKIKRDLPTLLSIVNAPVFLGFLYFGWQKELLPLILSGLLTIVIKFWFIDRMVILYERGLIKDV
jgi:hypothetical protein